MTHHHSIFVTGASGNLGAAVVDALLDRVDASTLVAGVRDEGGEAADALRGRGVAVRVADYDRPDTLADAFVGVDRLLLVSSNAKTGRVGQHAAVVDAARAAGVTQLIYTSILHADRSPLALAKEHLETERIIGSSGLPCVILRNGWYLENYGYWVAQGLEKGVILGAAGDGKIAAAARADYAEAAAVVLVDDERADRTYELAGDGAFTMTDLAAKIAASSGREVRYEDLSPADFEDRLVKANMPRPLAAMLADVDAGTSKGALDDGSHDLSRLIGRPTTPCAAAVARMVEAGAAST